MPLLTLKEQSDLMKNNRTSLFWRREGGVEYMTQIVGIHRLMWRGSEDRQIAIFKCLPVAKAWIDNITEGYLEVRWMDVGPLDNPFVGERVCTIKNIELTDAWINKLSPMEYEAEFVTFHFMARCDIEWDLFEMPDMV